MELSSTVQLEYWSLDKPYGPDGTWGFVAIAFMAYTAYILTPESRAMILERFPPRFGDVVCHHVTERFGVPGNRKLMPLTAEIIIVGHASDDSLEALIVSVNGVTARPDGMVYHITLSLDRSKGRKPADSNRLIASAGWRSVPPLAIETVPQICQG